ncbi:MAG: hypothetical protein IPK26_07995 [Planctomycetes bacterium]|nr:hypothetical protein [Planctomycetota bacterium]
MRCSVLPVIAGLLAIVSVRSQVAEAPPRPDPDAVASVFANTGLQHETDGFVGVGREYVVRMTADGICYTPALGRRAPRDLPWTWRLTQVGRGGHRLAVERVQPTADGQTVNYRHAVCTASHELRADGVKQSFVFDQLPAGAGDLVVRGLVDTELSAGAITPQGIAFALPEIGGVQIGAVVGIDGAGRQIAGSMRFADGVLEFVLPAAFVDSATMPLVVDPLIGTTSTLGGGNDDLVPEIAYDASTDTFLVVWQRDLSLLNQDIRAQRLSGVGALIGGTLALESSTTSATRPVVANVNMRNAFIVCWQQAGDIMARGVASATGVLSTVLTAAGTGDTETQVDLAGEDNDSIDDDVLCVWANTTTGDIESRQIAYLAGGTLSPGGLITFANPLFSTYSNPSISMHGGGAGVFLLCWESFGSLSNKTTVRGAVVTRNLATVVADFQIATHTFDARDPACDGDGDRAHWVVAFEREEAAGGDTDVYCVPVHLDGTTVVLGSEMAVDSGAGDDERDPAVCWTQDSCLVAWADEAAAGNYDTYVTSLEPLRCNTCEGRFGLDTATTTTANFPAMAWRYQSTAFDNNHTMIVWQSFVVASSTGDIAYQRFGAIDGTTTYVGPGCGVGGFLHTKCARAGNSAFRFELRGAAASGTALLVLSPTRVDLPCGSCTLVPDPWLGFVAGFTGTNATGDASWPLSLPAGVGGMQLYAQWVSTGTQCFSGLDLSNAARVSLN